MDDFSKGGGVHKTDGLWWVIFKGGVHETDGFWWVIFQRGEYMKPMGSDGFWDVFLLLLKVKRPGRLFRQIRYTVRGFADRVDICNFKFMIFACA